MEKKSMTKKIKFSTETAEHMAILQFDYIPILSKTKTKKNVYGKYLLETFVK